MPTRKFSELIDAMPPERRQHIKKRFEESIASMPLDEIRKAREMTQIQLSEVLGVHQSEVSKIEHRSDICISNFGRLCRGSRRASRNPRSLSGSPNPDQSVQMTFSARQPYGEETCPIGLMARPEVDPSLCVFHEIRVKAVRES